MIKIDTALKKCFWCGKSAQVEIKIVSTQSTKIKKKNLDNSKSLKNLYRIRCSNEMCPKRPATGYHFEKEKADKDWLGRNN